MLGQLWIVPMLNSCSRATKRGGQDKSGDRTSAVQTGGKMPEPIVDLKNSRAITAVQLKEMLRQYLDCIGPGAGLRKIGVEKAAWLYDRSETFRDMVLKVNMATELRDPKFNAHALFAGHPNLSPKDDAQKRQWAQECKDHYPELLQTLDIEKMCKDPEQSDKLLGMLSRLFAYLEVEWDETQQFLLQMRQHIYPKETGSLISHYPMLQKQIEDVTYEGEPLSYILARQAQHVANGRKLDQVYPGINKQKIPGSLLSGVARMIGNAGTGLTAFRKMLSGFCENLFADFRDNLRPGSIRALHEAAKINRAMAILPHREKTVCRFFDQEHINELETRLQNRPGVTAS